MFGGEREKTFSMGNIAAGESTRVGVCRDRGGGVGGVKGIIGGKGPLRSSAKCRFVGLL